MTRVCFALFDRKLGRYDIPRFAADEREATVLFQRGIEAEVIPAKFAADYDLYKLGYIDDANGQLTSDILFLANGSEFVKAKEE